MSLVPLVDFAELYGFERNTPYVLISQGSLPEHLLTSDRGTAMIDYGSLIRRQEFRMKVRRYIQDMYFLLNKVWNDAKLSKLSGITQTYFCYGLWTVDVDKSVLNYKVNKGDWKFFRFCRRVQRLIKKRYGVTFDVKEILDTETNGNPVSWEEYKKRLNER